MHTVQTSHLVQQLRHDKLCAYPNPLKLDEFFDYQYHCNLVYGIDVGAMHILDVGSFFTDHSIVKEGLIFQLLASLTQWSAIRSIKL